jgi:hypothetical protein
MWEASERTFGYEKSVLGGDLMHLVECMDTRRVGPVREVKDTERTHYGFK